MRLEVLLKCKKNSAIETLQNTDPKILKSCSIVETHLDITSLRFGEHFCGCDLYLSALCLLGTCRENTSSNIAIFYFGKVIIVLKSRPY